MPEPKLPTSDESDLDVEPPELPPAPEPFPGCPKIGEGDTTDLFARPSSGAGGYAFQYVVQTFVPKVRSLNLIKFHLNRLLFAGKACKWERLFECSPLTGDLAVYHQLWRIPGGVEFAAALAALKAQPRYVQFLSAMESTDHQLLAPMRYDPRREDVDPPAGITPDDPTPVILWDRVRVAPGALPRLVCAKERYFIPHATKKGWTLLAAALAGGDPPVLMQWWSLPTADKLPKTMDYFAQDPAYLRGMMPCIAGEEQNLWYQQL